MNHDENTANFHIIDLSKPTPRLRFSFEDINEGLLHYLQFSNDSKAFVTPFHTILSRTYLWACLSESSALITFSVLTQWICLKKACFSLCMTVLTPLSDSEWIYFMKKIELLMSTLILKEEILQPLATKAIFV